MREVENITRDEVRSAAALRVKLDRANKVVLRAVTSEDAKRVLTNTDVIDVICGPLQTKIRQLQQQLKAEKLKTKHVLRHQQKLEKELAYQKVKTSRRVERLETELEETKSSLLRQNAADLQKYKQHLIQEAERHEKLLKTSQGLSGTKLGSDQYHTDNPYDCRRYFGFPSWQELKVYVKCMFAVTCCVSKSEFSTRTSFEKFLISKMFLKTSFRNYIALRSQLFTPLHYVHNYIARHIDASFLCPAEFLQQRPVTSAPTNRSQGK